jgi:2-polyprenyl-6-methoxyphenol hydroxylase-like FAD-dependent oxidoreductase
MHRASLQKALLKKLPSDILHLGKRVIGVDASNGKNVFVTFEDLTSVTADLVIGADGIKSVGLHSLLWHPNNKSRI